MKPINSIWCVGRNYREHIKELNNDIPKAPLIFLKSGKTLVANHQTIFLPSWTTNIHHELELGVLLNESLHVSQACLCLDLTARDLQSELKKAGHPWTLAKSFKNACPIGEIFNIDDLAELQQNGSMSLSINNELRQQGYFKDMIFSIHDLVEYIKEHFPVAPGDLILTGTPAGVGPLKSGDKLRVELNGVVVGKWDVG